MKMSDLKHMYNKRLNAVKNDKMNVKKMFSSFCMIDL